MTSFQPFTNACHIPVHAVYSRYNFGVFQGGIMSIISRRDAGKLLLAGCAGALVPAGKLRGATKINSVIRGVQIGAQSYSFRDLPQDDIIKAFQTVGLGECELSDL